MLPLPLLYLSVNVTVPPVGVAFPGPLIVTFAVIVTTAPLVAGVGLVVTVSAVAVFAAHAAGPAVPIARAPNSIGISRPTSTRLEVMWRLKERIGVWVMGFKVRKVGTVSRQARP